MPRLLSVKIQWKDEIGVQQKGFKRSKMSDTPTLVCFCLSQLPAATSCLYFFKCVELESDLFLCQIAIALHWCSQSLMVRPFVGVIIR